MWKIAILIIFVNVVPTQCSSYEWRGTASHPKPEAQNEEMGQIPESMPVFRTPNTRHRCSHIIPLLQDLAQLEDRQSSKSSESSESSSESSSKSSESSESSKSSPKSSESSESSKSSSESSESPESSESTELGNRDQESPILGDQEVVDTFVQTVMSCKNVPGLSVAVVKGAKSWTEGYGVRDVESGQPVDSGTLFGVGSVTKTFTSALLAVAVNEAQRHGEDIGWQTRVKDVMGEDLELTQHLEVNVTLEDILSHRTGIMAADIMAVAGFPAHFSRAHFLRELRHLPEQLPFRLFWLYNNWIYSLAGDVTEYLMGDTWNTLLKERLLLPLGMEDSLIVWDDVNVTSSKMARPYQRIRGTLQEVAESLFELRQGRPSGALAVSADDMVKWMTWVLRGGVLPSGQQLVSTRLMESLKTPRVLVAAKFPDVPVGDAFEGYGLGWFIGAYRGKRTVSHTGGWFGYRCTLTLFPDDDVAVYVATSGPGTSAASKAYRAISYFLADLALGYSPWLNQTSACAFGEEARDKENGDKPEEEEDMKKITNPQRFVGTYTNPLFGEVVIRDSDSYDGLAMQFQRLSGILIPSEREFEFHVQYTGDTAFYSADDFETKRSRLTFSRHNLTPDGRSSSLVLRAPPPENTERLEFTRTG